MLELKLENLKLVPEKKILKAEEYATFLDAAGIIASAEARATTILKEATAVYESEKARGFAEGQLDGKAEIAERMMDVMTRSVDHMAKIEQDMVSIVLNALRRILGEIDERERIQKIVQNAIKVVHNQKDIVVRVCASQSNYVRESIDALKANARVPVNIVVVPDERMKENQCTLETELGSIDASMETQLRAIENSIRKAIL
ncbi:MAG TPA: HrpE/YscL family type III secretion apparatus protein [Opitutae bacterium]|nr:HrpE/YscL family type III secretion apparatus protein [Opitutae bacterium]